MKIEAPYIPEPKQSDYGVKWPADVDQITKELAGFRRPHERGFGSRYEHGMRLVQMLWPEQVDLRKNVRDWRNGEWVEIENTYFTRAFHALCENQRVNLTGSASSGKTFAVAVYALLSFMSNPAHTLVMISTTASTDSERRVWGDVKDLWRACQDRYPLGTLIDHLKAITFDPGRELSGKRDVSERDLGSGICVIAIPKGSEGEKAQGKIIGTKVKEGRLIWIIEEMPHMMDGVLKPEANLESNPDYQLVVTGNANRKTDPHGLVSEPTDGWDSVDETHDGWMAGDMFVCFLHGERGPNDHPAVSRDITDKKDFPFPYLSNRVFNQNVAYRNGYGRSKEERIENGKQTIDYMRFAVGFWYSDDIEPTILSSKMIAEHGAETRDVAWSPQPKRVIAGFDCGWTAGGDKNSLMRMDMGNKSSGEQILMCANDVRNIKSNATTNASFRRDIAEQVVDICIGWNMEPEDFYMDTSGDGGLMALEVGAVWGEKIGRQVRINGISSLEKDKDDDSRYHDTVTKLWFRTQEAVKTGRLLGFNVHSGYAKDLFTRRYESVGKGTVKIEPKGNKKTSEGKGYKQRMGRSPDDGDSFVYCLEGAIRSGFDVSQDIGAQERMERVETIEDIIRGRQSTDSEDDEYFSFEEAETVAGGWSQEESW